MADPKKPEETTPKAPAPEKKKEEETPIEVKKVEQKVDNETVTMNKEDYISLLNRVSNLEKGVVSDNVLDAPDEHFVRIRTFDGKYVIGHDVVTSRLNDKLEEEQYIIVRLSDENGKTEDIEVRYLDYIQRFDQITVKVLERRSKDKVTKNGLIDKVIVDGHGTKNAGFKVPARVVTPEETFIVELDNGKKLELTEQVIN